jgi:hypothetical protein
MDRPKAAFLFTLVPKWEIGQTIAFKEEIIATSS